jgi:hypothetical protein
MMMFLPTGYLTRPVGTGVVDGRRGRIPSGSFKDQCALSAIDPCTWVSGRMLRPAEMKGLVVPHLSRSRLRRPEYRCSGTICGGTGLDTKFRRHHHLVSRCSQIGAAVNATATKWVEQMPMLSRFYRLQDGTLATIKPAYAPASTNGLSNYPPLFCSSCHFTVRAHQSSQWAWRCFAKGPRNRPRNSGPVNAKTK